MNKRQKRKMSKNYSIFLFTSYHEMINYWHISKAKYFLYVAKKYGNDKRIRPLFYVSLNDFYKRYKKLIIR